MFQLVEYNESLIRINVERPKSSHPVCNFMKVDRLVLLKGTGFANIARNFLVIGPYSLIINALAIFNYRKVN